MAAGRRSPALPPRPAWLHPHALRQAALDALGRDVGARRATGEDLAGIHRPVRIESDARALHRVQILGPEDPEHEVVLLEPDAVLARKRPTGVDRDLEDLRAGFHDALDRLHRAVEEQNGMEIAVAD